MTYVIKYLSGEWAAEVDIDHNKADAYIDKMLSLCPDRETRLDDTNDNPTTAFLVMLAEEMIGLSERFSCQEIIQELKSVGFCLNGSKGIKLMARDTWEFNGGFDAYHDTRYD